MIIFILIILILVILKVKIELYLDQNGFEYDYKINVICMTRLFSITKKKLEKYIRKGKNKQKSKNSKIKVNDIVRYIKIEKFNAYIKLGLLNMMPTVFSIPIISTIVSGLLAKYGRFKKNRDVKFDVIPIYNELYLSTKLHCIVSTRIGYIIYIVIKMKIEGRKNNGRTSNRRTNEYCHD